MRTLALLAVVSLSVIVFTSFNRLLADGAAASGGVCKSTELVTKFGEWFSSDVWLTPEDPSETHIVPSLSGSPPVGIRLLIAVKSSLNAHWRLVIRAPSARIVAIFTPGDFEGPDNTRWTGILDVPQVSGELIGAQLGDKIEIRSGVALTASNGESRLFSIQGNQANWKSLYDDAVPDSMRRTGDAVGILVRSDESMVGQGAAAHPVRTSSCCSGVMVSKNIFMTNWHCGLPSEGVGEVWNAQIRTHTIVDLGWNSEGNQRLQYNVVGLLDADKDLDYALLRVEPVAGAGGGFSSPEVVPISLEAPHRNDILYVIHHAQCLPKRISFTNCRVVAASHRGWTQSDTTIPAQWTDMTHTCDTEPGASGAPVFNASGKMIALHHLGFTDATNCSGGPKENKAILIENIEKRVVDHLRSLRPDVLSELGWH